MYERAEKLGMTVDQLLDNMSAAEFYGGWMALDSLRGEERAKADRLARMKAKRRRGD